VVLGLACPYLGRKPDPRSYMGTPGAWVALPRVHSRTRAPRGETWCLGCLPMRWGHK